MRKQKIYPENTIEDDQITQFSENATNLIWKWRNSLSAMLKNKSKSVVWSAGAKGVSFLNILKMPESNIVGVVDINPRKQGMFIPLTGQQILIPNELKKINPEFVIVMNSIYLK